MNSEVRLLKPLQFCQRYNVGRTKMFEEIKEKRLKAVKVGRCLLIPNDSAEEWARSLPAREAA
jgi:excisionase family DNA binding protein